uniref:Uncharacterized protein n=1 Tax=Zea mays TaxID=4577 RepID=A0A804RCA2_MAIZE
MTARSVGSRRARFLHLLMSPTPPTTLPATSPSPSGNPNAMFPSITTALAQESLARKSSSVISAALSASELAAGMGEGGWAWRALQRWRSPSTPPTFAGPQPPNLPGKDPPGRG